MLDDVAAPLVAGKCGAYRPMQRPLHFLEDVPLPDNGLEATDLEPEDFGWPWGALLAGLQNHCHV